MESKFLDQDVDVVFLAHKGVVIGSFVGRNNNKILMETGKFMDNISVTKNGLGSGVDRMFKPLDSAFNHITNRLNPFGKSVEVDKCLLADSHILYLKGPAYVFQRQRQLIRYRATATCRRQQIKQYTASKDGGVTTPTISSYDFDKV